MSRCIAAGFQHSILLTPGGQAASVGGNSHGELGHGHTTRSRTTFQVLGSTGSRPVVESVAAGGFRSAVVTREGEVLLSGTGSETGEEQEVVPMCV